MGFRRHTARLAPSVRGTTARLHDSSSQRKGAGVYALMPFLSRPEG